MLRLRADDPAVLARTADAAAASNTARRPPLEFRCAKCRTQLARVGDIPGYGPLFVSSWRVWPYGHSVVAAGHELHGRKLGRWLAEHFEVVEQSGHDPHAPQPHWGAIALLALPAEMAQDYPDLLMRCEKHGDHVADRTETIRQLRGIPAGKTLRANVTPSGERFDYYPPRELPGMDEVSHHAELQDRFTPMTIAEFNHRRQRGIDRWRQRRGLDDTP